MTGRQGSVVGFLARVRADTVIPRIPQPPALRTSPAFDGLAEAYIERYPEAAAMLRNAVKKCAHCGKPNGFTLHCCNQCGLSLTETPVSFTTNVFMGFALGVGRGPFPLTISIRHQDTSSIVLDDLLALSPLHINVIPTDSFIPDWRYLLRQPRRGLTLIRELLGKCHTVARTQFLGNSEWTSRMLAAGHRATTTTDADADDGGSCCAFDVAAHMCYGFNYPPSQNQLHIQYICPNVMPFQHAQFLKGVHFTCKRFFPLEYVARCLELLIAEASAGGANENAAAAERSPMPPHLLREDADIEAIIDYFAAAHDHDYAAAHAQFLKRFADLSDRFSNWSSDMFEGVVVRSGSSDVFLPSPSDGAAASKPEVVDAQAVAASDKLSLQNYGRPYDPTTLRPTGSYYAFPKEPKDVTAW